jgi:hypothetical protein
MAHDQAESRNAERRMQQTEGCIPVARTDSVAGS